jgi:predicted MFS family arabinose efflux permease
MLLTIPFAFGMRADRGVATSHDRLSVREAFSQAIQYRDFWLLCLGFFVCGFQVIFISLHLPAYITDLGVAPGVGVTALALIGLFNIIGTLLAGYFGGKRNKSRLLVFLYLMRAVIIVAFLLVPISDWTVYLFAALMGLFWLGTVPLTNGLVATMFGVGHMSMLTGIVFLAHQIGSFLGGWLGGAVFDATGSYLPVWTVAVGLSLMAATVHAFIRDQPARLEAVSA